MVKLNKIYTRTGDQGKTGLADGSRVDKDDLRVAAYGAVDEANAALGLARNHVDKKALEDISRIQNDLFDLGADLSTPIKGAPENALRIVPGQVLWLEHQMDILNENIAPLTSFILPGGTEAAAALHLARTIVRRAERKAVTLGKNETINAEALKYLNRLSDYLFVLGRHLNENGKNDVLWVPGKSRKG